MRKNQLLSIIANTERSQVDRHVSVQRYSPGRVVLEDRGLSSGPEYGLGYIQHGRMEMLITTPEGNERCMRILSDADMFGLECLHSRPKGEPRGYQVRAITFAAVVRIDVELVDFWLATSADFRAMLASHLATDVFRMEQERERTLAFSVAERLVCYLRCGEVCLNLWPAPTEPVGPLPMNILARRIGCSPGYLSRTVRELMHKGVLKRVNRIPKIDCLENFSDCPCSALPENRLPLENAVRSA